MILPEVPEDELPELYAWVDELPLSKPKKSIARDFADAVCMAETIHTFFPRLVDLHNYSPTSNTAQKFYNWQTLNARVFKRLGFTLPKEMLEAAAMAEPGIVERILKLTREKMIFLQERKAHSRLSQLHHQASLPELHNRHALTNPALPYQHQFQQPYAMRPESAPSSLMALAQPGVHPPDVRASTVSASWMVPLASQQHNDNTNPVGATRESVLPVINTTPLQNNADTITATQSDAMDAYVSMFNHTLDQYQHNMTNNGGGTRYDTGREPFTTRMNGTGLDMNNTAAADQRTAHHIGGSPLRVGTAAVPLTGATQHNIQQQQYSTAPNGGSNMMEGGGCESSLVVEVQNPREANQILELKVAKLEQLLRLKDAKISALASQLETVMH